MLDENKPTNLNDDIETVEEAEFRLEEKKWETRKMIAIRSFYGLIAVLIVTLGIFVFIDDISKFTVIENVLITIVLGFVSIVGFYFGASTWADIKRK